MRAWAREELSFSFHINKEQPDGSVPAKTSMPVPYHNSYLLKFLIILLFRPTSVKACFSNQER